MSDKPPNCPNCEYDPPLDPGIRRFVQTLNSLGVETYESCQGGIGHAVPEPMVRFHGDAHDGLRAASIALRAGLPLAELRRLWSVQDGEMTGPTWEMTFWKNDAASSSVPTCPICERKLTQGGDELECDDCCMVWTENSIGLMFRDVQAIKEWFERRGKA